MADEEGLLGHSEGLLGGKGFGGGQSGPPNVDHVLTLTTAPEAYIIIIRIGSRDLDSDPVPPEEDFKSSFQDGCSKPSTTFQCDSNQALTRPV